MSEKKTKSERERERETGGKECVCETDRHTHTHTHRQTHRQTDWLNVVCTCLPERDSPSDQILDPPHAQGLHPLDLIQVCACVSRSPSSAGERPSPVHPTLPKMSPVPRHRCAHPTLVPPSTPVHPAQPGPYITQSPTQIFLHGRCVTCLNYACWQQTHGHLYVPAHPAHAAQSHTDLGAR